LSGIRIHEDSIRADLRPFLDLFMGERYSAIKATYAPDKSRGLPKYHLHRAKAHPLAVILHNLNHEIDISEKSKKIGLTAESYYFVDTISRLKCYSEPAEVMTPLRHISIDKQVHSALFEAHTFSIYKQRKMDIRPIIENEQKSPDFVVCGFENDVFVECKSLEDKSKQENKCVEEIGARVLKSLKQSNRCWYVKISADRIISGADINPLVDVIKQRIAKNISHDIPSKYENITITFTKIAQPDTWYTRPPDPPTKATEVWYESDTRINPDGSLHFRNPVCFEFIPCDSLCDFDRISRNISIAHKQLPKGRSGIVHIELPYRNGSKLLDITDPVFDRIYNFLRNKPIINAVIISGRTIDKNTKNLGGSITTTFNVIIPNPEPAVQLPNGFSLPVSSEGNPLNIQNTGGGRM